MHCIIAMAGLAEAAEFYGLLIFTGVLLIAAGLLALGWWKCWPFAALLACVICVLVGWFVQPWQVLKLPMTADPDQTYWLFRWRVFSGVWAAFCVAGVASLCILVRRSKLRDAQNAA